MEEIMKGLRTISVFLVLLLIAGGAVFAGGAKEGGGKKIINVASTYPAGSPPHLGIERFKAEFEKATNGRYEVLIHAASAMAGERETFEMVEDGSVEIGMIGMMDIIMDYPRWTCSEVPFILPPDPAYFWKFWAGPGKELNDLIEKEHNVRTVGTVLRGARYMTANKPIPNLAAAKGVKIRLPDLKIANDIFAAYGMIPANIAFGDLYMALKTGVVDAQENPPETILNYKFYEAQKYLMATRHIFSSARFQVSLKWFNTLSQEDQNAFNASMKTGVDYANELTKNGDEGFIKQLIDLGMILVEVSDEFYNIAQPLLEEFGKTTLMPGLYQRVKDL
jgi:TRAP-type C4-dicarboxylate transport system substrate-binding protein